MEIVWFYIPYKITVISVSFNYMICQVHHRGLSLENPDVYDYNYVTVNEVTVYMPTVTH